VFYVSFRLPNPSPHPYLIAPGGGISKYTQLLQFKSFGNGLGNSFHPPLEMNIGRNGIKMKVLRGSEKIERMAPMPNGQWIRLALVVNWSSNGWVEAWADTTNSGTMTKITDRVTGVDFLEGRSAGAIGIGEYHQIDLFDGTVSGQPRQDVVYTDYANIQRTQYLGL
jgi:hypothetical protein